MEARACVFGGRIRRAFVETHGHIGAQRALNAHGFLGRQEHLRAIDRRAKVRPFLGDLAHLRQAPDLEPARVGEDRPAPMHEAMQPLMSFDDFEPRPQVKMKGIAEHDFGADGFEILRRHRLDRAIRAHRHERRRLDRAARELEPAAPRRAVLRQQVETHRPARRCSLRRGSETWHHRS